MMDKTIDFLGLYKYEKFIKLKKLEDKNYEYKYTDILKKCIDWSDYLHFKYINGTLFGYEYELPFPGDGYYYFGDKKMEETKEQYIERMKKKYNVDNIVWKEIIR